MSAACRATGVVVATKVMMLIFAGLTGGTLYLTAIGFAAESSDVTRSIREGSAGVRVGYIGGVK